MLADFNFHTNLNTSEASNKDIFPMQLSLLTQHLHTDLELSNFVGTAPSALLVLKKIEHPVHTNQAKDPSYLINFLNQFLELF